MLGFISKIFVWWKDATPGTLLTISSRGGKLVGKDEFGNKYYEEKGVTGPDGNKRRWVIYNGYADASRVPSDWHGWMHHTFEHPPTEAPLKRQTWEKDHHPNLTGTVHAYRPSGSLARAEDRQAASGDYEAWKPE
ncbi:MAG: NADH:ubiquinone oxidoreductase subunit NDUFA12 [Maricaulis sp.]|jgi:NADH:ubiquinone oxidoreductase subunit|uniref:NADH:ubiquinone oxidoreductase subunit NDUFA12 n=1 Tax=Maricaulis sp. TaxID=1486257 RepID=UPI001B25645B|nr:NADH:ubiquinone oxidoreductase subunit NDUFA12 [Maricaulis sp.]MEC9250091.1 NADH:ubiquinone oxidoreductase subunit NDUFA12 [Pseudomonadota bacterium]MBO6730899.1 NADH:ubiquinone oxidoreductase subunit NDUFA12 [Maricaulis sp.]MBO6847840.1 NADH:ubiquinone oxidoreductase subunit NDUFA12 [Maricaulis sp.]MBO6877463.1 NADH:ubiquinone oxidoreductase subunit NDUFA12 [Maricaulis sp.]MDM7983531.1 NADH:ubiquinone oxidoreductase subunit NDUFA12 [Maricaulis sp.]